MDLTPVELSELREAFAELAEVVCDHWDGNDEPSPELVSKALLQLFDLLERNQSGISSRTPLNPEELDELGEYGLTLLQEMSAFGNDLGIAETADRIEDLSFPFAVWLSRCGAEIRMLEPVVNALARQANTLEQPHQLRQLFTHLNEILESLSPQLTQALETDDDMHPYQLLVINRAIIATRTLDTELMSLAFEHLVETLPDDAARFFEEGLEQMQSLNYPDHVRQTMQHYYLLHGTSRTLH